MRFLFITIALLYFSYAMATGENEILDAVPLTEEQVDEAVFSVEQEMAKEIEGAVKTINEVFGNPGCNDKVKRRVARIWCRKRSNDESNVEKRALCDYWTGVHLHALRKRSEPVHALSLKKRSWGDFWKGVAIGVGVSILFGKRAEPGSELEVEKRWGGWPYSKRSDYEKRLFTNPYTKRSDDENKSNTEQIEQDWFLSKRSDGETALKNEKIFPDDKISPIESSKAENEFRADIAKLERALEVLNDVLQIPKATVKSE